MTDALTALFMLVLGALFLYVAHLFYEKSWRFGCTLSVCIAAIFLMIGLPPAREFMRTTAWAAFVTALETTGQGLVRLNTSIDRLREGIDAERAKSEEQREELARIQRDTQAMQGLLADAQAKIASQQEKLSDLSSLIKGIYEASKTATRQTSEDSKSLVVVEHAKGKVSVYVLLPEPPIPQTLELQWRVAVQPRNSYEVDSNLVVFRWGESESSFRKQPLLLTYVPDPTKKPEYQSLEKRGQRTYLDGIPLVYAYADEDPVLQRLWDSGAQTITQDDFAKAVKDEELQRRGEQPMVP